MKSDRDERQEESRIKWIKNKCNGVFVYPTGFGKTVTALKCLKSVLDKYPSFKILIVVPTKTLKEQWQIQVDNWGFSFNTEVQVINSVILHNWNVDIIVLDEIHRYCSEEYITVFTKVKYKCLLGLTATFERLDGRHKLIEKYCKVIDLITKQEALIKGWISPFTEYEVLIEVDDIDEYRKLNKEFTSYFEFFGFNFSLAMSMIGSKGYINRTKLRDTLYNGNDPKKKSEIMQAITRNAVGLMRTMQKRKAFINNHPKKLEIVRRIIKARPNSKIITFSNNVNMAKAIGIGDIYTGKTSKKKSSDIISEFNIKDKAVINSVHRLDEGADLKGLSVAIILGIDSSTIKSTQRLGRVVRLEKDKNAEIFNIIINNTTEVAWFQNSHKDFDYKIIDEDGLNKVLDYQEPGLCKVKVDNVTFSC